MIPMDEGKSESYYVLCSVCSHQNAIRWIRLFEKATGTFFIAIAYVKCGQQIVCLNSANMQNAELKQNAANN